MAIQDDVYEKLGLFYMGRRNDQPDVPVLYDSRDLLTHAVCVGMTGSGKTGLCIGLLEEALMDKVPAIVIDPKGDLGNLLLAFPSLDAASFRPWVDHGEAQRKGMTVDALAQHEADKWKQGLQAWGQSEARIKRWKEQGDVVLYTPGSSSGRPISVLSSLNAPTTAERDDFEAISEKIEGTVSSILTLVGLDADPMASPEHTFLSAILSNAWQSGQDVTLASLIRDLSRPPFSQIGVMQADDVLPANARIKLANRLNSLVAAPSFQAWLAGDPLDIDALLHDKNGRPRISILSIAHLSEREQQFFTTLLLNRVVSWMRTQRGTTSLRALLYIDEVAGLVPPVANPPTKKPVMTMLKQARAYGLGLVLATQNPGDIDYKALSNAGTWFIGRLQTDRDRDKMLQGLDEATQSWGSDAKSLNDALTALEPRQFVLHNVHDSAPVVFQTRWVMSYLKGPLTMQDVRELTHGYEHPEPETIEPNEPSADRAVLPEAIDEYFLKIGVPAPDGARLLWRPMLYGYGDVQFDNAKLGIKEDVDFGFIVGFDEGPVAVDWSKSFTTTLDLNLFDQDPEQDGEFLGLPAPAYDTKNHKIWQKELADHAYRNVTFELLECESLRLVGRPGETEREFRVRIADAVRERRDDDLDAVNGRYRKKLEKVEDKIHRLEDRLAKEQDQAKDASTDTLMAIGGGIFDAFTGRSSRSAVRRSTSSARRASKEKGDVERAQAQLNDARDEHHEIAMEFETELTRVSERHDPGLFQITVKPVSPRKSDVRIQLAALVWVPYWLTTSGERVRAV